LSLLRIEPTIYRTRQGNTLTIILHFAEVDINWIGYLQCKKRTDTSSTHSYLKIIITDIYIYLGPRDLNVTILVMLLYFCLYYRLSQMAMNYIQRPFNYLADHGCSRYAPCALSLISTFLLSLAIFYQSKYELNGWRGVCVCVLGGCINSIIIAYYLGTENLKHKSCQCRSIDYWKAYTTW
jgi:hypothetical protein